ncbi:hypothetical protein ACIP2X_37685 [Streptomyces sp. NPDC089424]|uniref:hypothetical protein n=1 Tax=Streptomyces sp. NPDC089424 TaxID=3365917 RepID=UPI0038217C28
MARPLRDRLKTAAELLRTDGHPDAAMDVEAVLAPGGWTLLRDTKPSGTDVVSMPFTMDKRLKDALMAAAQDTGTVLSAAVVEGWEAFLAGEFVPPKVRQVRGAAGYSKTTLTVTVPEELRDRVSARIPQVMEEAGYRITLSSIGVEWLMEELGVERPLD